MRQPFPNFWGSLRENYLTSLRIPHTTRGLFTTQLQHAGPLLSFLQGTTQALAEEAGRHVQLATERLNESGK